MNLKSIIPSINSWNDFKSVLETKTKLEKGKAFEELTKYYLEYNPIYKTKLKNVWLQNEVPSSVLKKLNLPTNDQGIDLIAETIEGNYWAIQCKYLQDEDQRLSHRAISTFVSLSTGIAENITYCLVCTTVDEYAKIYEGKENIGFCNSDEWRKLDKVFFDWLRNKLSGKEKKLIPYKPKPHQVKALKEATNYFVKEKNNRGKLVFPCGAGKSLTGYWITRELKSKSIIVAVPSLSLVKQTLEVYLRESVANNESVAWLCVCSDEGIGKNDDVIIHTNEIGVPCVTNKNVIADWLKKNSKNKTIIFTTYQSGKTISEACKIANHEFDLGIMDEAHKTVGQQDKLFSHLLFEKNIKIKKRIFMTATERRYAGSSDTVLSMDDVNVYGETFAQMSFKEAIDLKILSDYRIITLFISNAEVKNLIEKNAFVKPLGKEWDNETEARTLASLIALRKAMTEYPIHHAVTFHSSIKKAEAFEQSQSVFSKAFPKYAKVKSYHVSGKMATGERGKIVDEFAEVEKGIITNAKCLTEGVDVPNIDCVLFADPRKSTVDIVQAVGRALRKKEGKEFGYVIIPVFTESDDKEEIINSKEFQAVLSTLRALASNDERIVEYFRDISKGKKDNKRESIIQFDIDEQIFESINEKELIETIELKTWDKLAKLSWMPFEEARKFARGLNLSGQSEWTQFCQSGTKPIDIPYHPERNYKNVGWLSYGDWLGYANGSISNDFLDFETARLFVRKLGLKSAKDWKDYCKSGNKPHNIPVAVHNVYKVEWKGLGDFLGTGVIAPQFKKYRSFNDAKLFVSKLGLRSVKKWFEYCKSGKKPIDIPTKAITYKEWKGWGDFLGTGTIADRKKVYLSFVIARTAIRKLGIQSYQQWKEYCQDGKIPANIPNAPDQKYKSEWQGWDDFLGKESWRGFKLKFEDAREIARGLNLKSYDEWLDYCKIRKTNKNIPIAADGYYKNRGWNGWEDFLGNEKFTFVEAKNYLTLNGVNSKKAWKEFIKNKNCSSKLPRHPERVYSDSGWKGMTDFLGRKGRATEIEFITFIESRNFVRKLNLKSVSEWWNYSSSGKKPTFIPRNVQTYYKNAGWKGWTDFLGKE